MSTNLGLDVKTFIKLGCVRIYTFRKVFLSKRHRAVLRSLGRGYCDRFQIELCGQAEAKCCVTALGDGV
jgi:hypothetical protein